MSLKETSGKWVNQWYMLRSSFLSSRIFVWTCKVMSDDVVSLIIESVEIFCGDDSQTCFELGGMWMDHGDLCPFEVLTGWVLYILRFCKTVFADVIIWMLTGLITGLRKPS